MKCWCVDAPIDAGSEEFWPLVRQVGSDEWWLSGYQTWRDYKIWPKAISVYSGSEGLRDAEEVREYRIQAMRHMNHVLGLGIES